jgi:hypothetical protein
VDDKRLEELTDLTKQVGLRQIKTETIDVQMQSPLTLQRLKERLDKKTILFSNFPSSKATPNHCKYGRCLEEEC